VEGRGKDSERKGGGKDKGKEREFGRGVLWSPTNP